MAQPNIQSDRELHDALEAVYRYAQAEGTGHPDPCACRWCECAGLAANAQWCVRHAREDERKRGA
jgi:hypothetical protein